jgi:hypothetical protein
VLETPYAAIDATAVDSSSAPGSPSSRTAKSKRLRRVQTWFPAPLRRRTVLIVLFKPRFITREAQRAAAAVSRAAAQRAAG